ncbi:SH3 domain-containing protein 21 [Natator depressus]|uniref:SH3 domain-containing protein 21 n=1 Tax=Natator depressus TaxID=27790 RepID=UPI003EBD60DA
MGEVLVLVDFAGQRDDELQLKAGDIVRKVELGPEEGWLQGELAGKTGLFPRQFVQEIPASLMADGGRRCPRSTRLAKKPPVPGQRWCKANFSYTPEKADELQLKAGELVQILQEIEDGWWLGRKNGQVGAFPSNFVQELDRLPPGLVAPEPLPKNGAGKQRLKLTDETFIVKEAEQPEPPKKLEKPIPTAQSSPSSQPPQPSCKAEYCKAMFDYEPELQDELQLKRGDVILVLCKETEDEGWWEGECDGKRGLFPDNFVMLLQPVVPKVTAVVPSRSQESIFRPEKKVSSASKAELRPPREPKERASEGDPALMGPGLWALVCWLGTVLGPRLQPLASRGLGAVTSGEQPGSCCSPVPLPPVPKVQKKMDLPKMNLPASKKAAPAPPVPAKTKLASNLAGRPPCTPMNCAPASGEKSKPKDPDANCFDAILVSNAKLSHPTTTRPKMPGRKPPSQPPASSLKAPLVPAKSSIQARELQSPESPGDPPKAQEKLSLEVLMAEIRSLQIVMDLMRVQHQKDMEELKMEMQEERAKRMVLQVRAAGDAVLHGKFRGGSCPSPSLTGIPQSQALSLGC